MNRSLFLLATVVVLGGMLSAGAGSTAAHDDEFFVGDATIEEGEVVEGNVFIIDGNLLVLGEVEGWVFQFGTGGVTVTPGGVIGGSIKEYEEGGVFVFGVVEGDVFEFSDGFVNIGNNGEVDGSVFENGSGFVAVTAFARVGGHIAETGSGGEIFGTIGVLVSISSVVDGSIIEFDGGDVEISDESLVGGNVIELGPGEVFVDASSTVEGFIFQE